MRGIVIVSRFWTRMLSGRRALAITLFPFILVLDRKLLDNPQLMNHERIHLAQALEMLVLPFYIWYLIEFVIRYFRCRNFYAAYRSISFEREAYHHEGNLEYLRTRKLWTFLKYL